MDCFLSSSSDISAKASCGNHEFWWGPCIFLSQLTLLASLSRDGLEDHWIPIKKAFIFWWIEEQINKWGGASTLKAQYHHTEVAKGSLSGERAECTEGLGGPLGIGLHPPPRPSLFLSSSVPVRLAGPPRFGLTLTGKFSLCFYEEWGQTGNLLVFIARLLAWFPCLVCWDWLRHQSTNLLIQQENSKSSTVVRRGTATFLYLDSEN